MNKTDQTFEAHNPDYYIYEPEEGESRICAKEGCYKKFKSRLSLARFCSRACQEAFLSSFNLRGHKVK